MNISSIIAEYNPIHKGHSYHIRKTRELTGCDALICVMSGNYVQRGIPAIIDKWNRTKAALLNGVDLVIELPVVYSLSSAEFFSFGAISLLEALGVVDSVSFGSEIGDLKILEKLASILNAEPKAYKEKLKNHLQLGLAFPKARSKALYSYMNETMCDMDDFNNIEGLLNSSNNILAIEYCKSLNKISSSIKPLTIKREGAAYNSENINSIFPSATAIRKHLKEKNDINELKEHLDISTFNLISELMVKKYDFVFEESIYPYIKYKYFSGLKSLNNLPDVSEGLDNRIANSFKETSDYRKLIESIKSKRYTYTRISRILCQFFVGFEQWDTKSLRTLPCPYARVLGLNETGAAVLKKVKEKTFIPLITKLPRKINDTLSIDIQATRTYSLLNQCVNPNMDYLLSPIMIK